VLSLSVLHSDVFTCSANGQVKVCLNITIYFEDTYVKQRFSDTFDCTASWKAHDGIVLTSIISQKIGIVEDSFCLVTGGNDGAINVRFALQLHRRKYEIYILCLGMGSRFDFTGAFGTEII
jgi:di- and tripeptidase